MKSQTVRLIDVFVLGPFMVWSATQLKNETARVAMAAAGIATILYNWENYKQEEQNHGIPRTQQT